jgi:hypothetical protein
MLNTRQETGARGEEHDMTSRATELDCCPAASIAPIAALSVEVGIEAYGRGCVAIGVQLLVSLLDGEDHREFLRL